MLKTYQFYPPAYQIYLLIASCAVKTGRFVGGEIGPTVGRQTEIFIGPIRRSDMSPDKIFVGPTTLMQRNDEWVGQVG